MYDNPLHLQQCVHFIGHLKYKCKGAVIIYGCTICVLRFCPPRKLCSEISVSIFTGMGGVWSSFFSVPPPPLHAHEILAPFDPLKKTGPPFDHRKQTLPPPEKKG